MGVNPKEIKRLRELTGCGMMDCKKALESSQGDIETAIDILRKKGEKVSAKRADKEALCGSVFISVNEKNTAGVMITLNCETDFVAKNKYFMDLGHTLVEHALKQKASSIEALKQTGAEKILLEHIAKLGEKIEIGDLAFLEGEKLNTYIHSDKTVGVMVAMKNTENIPDIDSIGKDIAMQIAAMNPLYLDKENVPIEIVEREKQVAIEKERKSGKPENILEKIALGFVNKFYQEQTLLNQFFVKDNSKTVKTHLAGIDKSIKITEFIRFAVKR